MTLRRRLASSKLAPLAALPLRAGPALRHDLSVTGATLRWLATSREHTNYTYDLEPINREHLAWFVATITGCSAADARGWMDEVAGDEALAAHLNEWTLRAARSGISDAVPRFGRRLGWYALIRATQPERVVETGTDKGLGSCLMAAALQRNGHGRLSTYDINPESGFLIQPPYADVIDVNVGDSVEGLAQINEPVDIFLHDSLHTESYELAELDAVEARLSPNALVLSDNSHATLALSSWAERTGRRFLFFGEKPANHWYPGDGIGVAWR